MTLVFINYRSNDSAWAVLLDRELSQQFGSDRVFQASRSIPVGEDFANWIMSHLRRSAALLAIIGPDWSAAADESGRRRLLDDKDWVRREIAEAFTLGIPVVPILVNDAARLDGAELPADIAKLARCQYLRLHYRNAAYDVTRLADELIRLVPDLCLPAGTGHTSQPTPTRQSPAGRTSRAPRPQRTPHSATTRVLAWIFTLLVTLAVLTTAYVVNKNTSPPASPNTTQSTSQQTALESSPATESSPLPDGVLTQGTLSMKSPDVADLEQGRAGPAITGSDLYLYCSAGQCLLSGSGGIAIPTTPENKTACTTALSSRNDNPLDLPRLRTMMRLKEKLCVQTNELHIGVLQILNIPGEGTGELTFSYILWR
jgi:hypothetical protein